MRNYDYVSQMMIEDYWWVLPVSFLYVILYHRIIQWCVSNNDGLCI